MCSSNNLYHPDNLGVTGKGSVDDTEPVTVGLHIARALGMESTVGKPVSLVKTVKLDETDNRHNNDECVSPAFQDTWELRYATDAAATMRQEWMRYTNARKGHGPNNPLTMGDFAGYIKFWYETDILA